MMLAPGCRKMISRIGRFDVGDSGGTDIFDRVGDVATSPSRTGAPVAIGDDQRPVFVGLEQLIGGADEPALDPRSAMLPFGPVGVGVGQHGADVFQPQTRNG